MNFSAFLSKKKKRKIMSLDSTVEVGIVTQKSQIHTAKLGGKRKTGFTELELARP